MSLGWIFERMGCFWTLCQVHNFRWRWLPLLAIKALNWMYCITWIIKISSFTCLYRQLHYSNFGTRKKKCYQMKMKFLPSSWLSNGVSYIPMRCSCSYAFMEYGTSGSKVCFHSVCHSLALQCQSPPVRVIADCSVFSLRNEGPI